MEISFHNAIELLTAFQAFLFAGYLLSSRKKKNTSNVFIAFYLFALGLNVSHDYVDYYVTPTLPNLTIFLKMTVFLMAPALYLYTKTAINSDFKITWSETWHFLPFFVFNILLIPDYYLENLKENPLESESQKLYTISLFIGFYVQVFIYLLITFRYLIHLKKIYYEHFSNTDTSKYNYLFKLNSLIAFVFLLSAAKNFLLYSIEGPIINYASHIVLFAILILFCWIIFKGLHSPELFGGNDMNQPTLKEMMEEEMTTSKTKAGGASNEIEIRFKEMEDKLKYYMENNEPFLDSTLSIYDLAREIETSAKELSVFINHYLNKHFFDFINEYRIEKAKQLLKDPNKADYTILEILYDVGFNSKSSFNTAFKKHTGSTPTQFRKTY